MKKNKTSGVDQSRRNFLAGMAAAGGAALLPGCGSTSDLIDLSAATSSKTLPTLPAPEKSGIDHIVVVMMENRSYDHFMGWIPGSDGIQAGLQFKNAQGTPVDTFRLSQNPNYGFGGCAWADPDHSYEGGRVQLNGGLMNGWLLSGDTKNNPADHFPVGYFTGDDLPFYKGVADNWTICDRYFCGILSSTYPNRFYMHSGQTDRLTNTMDISSLPTIWDRLNAKGVSAAYYFSDLPLLALWGTKYVTSGNILPHATFLTQAALGQLPSVSYVEPRFLGEGNQVSNDDHPAADVRDGQAFVNGIYEALRQSPNWEKTLLIVNYDEWGGFYDHVVPPFGPVSDAERALGNDGRLGFRVPCMLIGPRAPKRICNLPFDPQSILNLITWRFGLDPVGSRADWSLNMALALDFDHLRTDIAPSFNTGIGPYGRPCGTPLDSVFSQIPQLPVLSSSNKAHFDEWQQLKELAIRYGLPMVP